MRLRLRPVLPATGDTRGEAMGPLATLGLDLRHGARSIRGTPWTSALIMTTLGIGVGATVVVYAVTSATLLEPLPYPGQERLMQVEASVASELGERAGMTMWAGDLAQIRETVTGFEDVAAVVANRVNLTGAGLPRRIDIAWATANLPGFLGVEPIYGRAFTPDDPPGSVLLAHTLWVDAFGADPAAVGRTIQLDGYAHTVLGVLPPDAAIRLRGLDGRRFGLWKNPDDFWQNGNVWDETLFFNSGGLRVVGRRAPDTSVEEVASQVAAAQTAIREVAPEQRAARSFELQVAPLRPLLAEPLQPTVRLLAGSVAALFLIAAANVMGLLLLRGHARGRELAVRRTLGAGRGRVARLLMAEASVLAVGVAAVAVLFAWFGTSVVAARVPILEGRSIDLDGSALGVAGLAALGAMLLVAVVPTWSAAWGGARVGGVETGAGRVTESSRVRDGLVVAQIALSFVLLVGSGLLLSTMREMRDIDPGFDTEQLLTFGFAVPGARYQWRGEHPSEAGEFLARVATEVEALPQVESAGVMWPIPLTGSWWDDAWWGGDVREEDRAQADLRVGTGEYFETLRIPLLAGRLHRPDDDRLTVVVSESVARRAWPDLALASVPGRTIRTNPWGSTTGANEFEVLGVVGDVRHEALTGPPHNTVYLDVRGWAWVDSGFDVAARVRAGVDPLSLVPAVREVVARLDPEVPVDEIATMQSLVDAEFAETRFVLGLAVGFGVLAVGLSLVGLYAVVSNSVARRTREIGIRMALGSAGAGIARLVVGQGARLIVPGVVLGAGLAVALAGFLDAWLYGVSPTDPSTLVVVAVVLGGCTLLAVWAPALRAARTDPAEVLRAE
jgi:predicted permease